MARPRLEGLGSNVLASRLTLLSAGPGYGKTTLIDRWVENIPAARLHLTPTDRHLATLAARLTDALRLRVPALGSRVHRARSAPQPGAAEAERASALASWLAEVLDADLARPTALVIDDVHEIRDSDGAALVENLVRHAPERLSIVLSGRADPPIRMARMRAQGLVTELTETDLGFLPEETAELAAIILGPAGRELGELVHRTTNGWPVAVRFALEAISDADPTRSEEVLTQAPRPGGRLFAYLAEEVFDSMDPAELGLLRRLAAIGPFEPAAVEAAGIGAEGATLTDIVRRSMFIEPISDQFRVLPLIASAVEGHLAVSEEERVVMHRHLAAWHAERNEPREALRHAVESRDPTLAASVIIRFAPRLPGPVPSEEVVAACSMLPEDDRPSTISLLLGEAQQLAGDWDGALQTFRAAAGGDGEVDPGLAWRGGLIHHLRGELDAATAWYRRADLTRGSKVDQAMVLAWHGSVSWLRGDAESCRRMANQAAQLAVESGDDRAIAASETVLAMLAAVDGDRRANEALYLRALDHAESAGDALQVVRIHVNRGSRHLEEGAYEEAIAETDIALQLAASSGFNALRALGLNNRGQARFRLGRLEEAATDFREARMLWDRLGSRQAAYSMVAMGDLHRAQGDSTVARSHYEAAIQTARPVSDLQALVPALAGMARVTAVDDPSAAATAVGEALAAGPVLGRVAALVAAAFVHLAQGDIAGSRRLAHEGLAVARERGDRAGMAEALEALAAAADEPRRHLNEAEAIWQAVGDPLGMARVRLRLGSIGEDGTIDVSAIGTELRRLGARGLAAEATELIERRRRAVRPEVTIGALGSFTVAVDGALVPVSAWQSRKARDLLKILVSRRGRATHREVLVETLWPEESPDRTANRLSVALTTIRGVLDPHRQWQADRYIEADREAVRLDIERIVVDLEAFHHAVADGSRADREGDVTGANHAFERAEVMYRGDLFEEDPFAEWAVSVREETRAAYMRIARRLSQIAAAGSDLDGAARYLLRILHRDPYDEHAHLELVSVMQAAGRHGEARRLYERYCRSMEEIDVEPAPYPGVRPHPTAAFRGP